MKTKIVIIMFFILHIAVLPMLYGNSVFAATSTSTQTTSTYNPFSINLTNLPGASRSASWYKKDTQTTPLGGTQTQYSYGADIGYGETGYGFSLTNPFTGATISYSTTGYGMGTIAAPIYGGANSIFGMGTYGPLWQTAATGIAPQTSPTIGYTTQTSQTGNLFGQGSTYAFSQPDYNVLLAQQLVKNPSTQALGYAVLGLSAYNYLNSAVNYYSQPYYGYNVYQQPYYGNYTYQQPNVR